MSSLTQVYLGPWINWSQGPVLGATITLSARSGGLLISFVATFVTVVGAQLWKILSYLFYQLRSTQTPQDALHHQQQNVFRNTATPGGAAWVFLMQTWFWRGRARSSTLRTLPWALFAILYIVLFGVLATFSAEVSKGQGNQRLLRPGDCGYWVLDEEGTADDASTPYMHKMANDSLVAASYARACYGGNPAILQCGIFPVSALTLTADQNATCPFDDGMCVYGDTAAYRVATDLLDSHRHLGINSPARNRIQYRKVTTCAPITQVGHTQLVNGSTEDNIGVDGDFLYEFYYGAINGVTNYTYRYNTHAYIDGFGYGLDAVASMAPHAVERGWIIDPALNRSDADVSMLFFAPNGVVFAGISNDPIFGAHTLFQQVTDEVSYYDSDLWVSTLACAEQHQICNPHGGGGGGDDDDDDDDDNCTPLVGANQVLPEARLLGLNDVQLTTAVRIAMNTAATSVYQTVWTRGANALRAQEVVANDQLSAHLPDNQWHIEVGSWFDTGLARLQHTVQEYAAGPQNIVAYSQLWQPGDAVHEAMCDAQLVRDTEGTVSFSVVGLVVIFVVGVVIVATSFVLDTVVGWVQRRIGLGASKDRAWVRDDRLQMQRTIFAAQGAGRWENSWGFPVTAKLSEAATTHSHNGDNSGEKFVANKEGETLLYPGSPNGPLASPNMQHGHPGGMPLGSPMGAPMGAQMTAPMGAPVYQPVYQPEYQPLYQGPYQGSYQGPYQPGYHDKTMNYHVGEAR